MISPRTTILTFVAAGCVAAAGIGGYVAARNGAASPLAAEKAAADASTEVAVADAAQRATASSARTGIVADAPRVQAAQPIRPEAARAVSPGPAALQPSSQAADAEPAKADPSQSDQDVASSEAGQNTRDEEPARVQEPERPLYDELTVPAEAVVGIRLDSPVSSEMARVEDRVTARVARDVTVDGQTAIRAGSRLEGNVTLVERGGKFRDRARIGIRFNTLVLADNTRLPIQTDVIMRMGDAPGNEATAKVGGAAVVGTILGSVFGGKKGAAIGSAAGAAGGAAAVAAGGRNAAIIPADTALTVRLTAPLAIDVPREPATSR